jgi:hypothetical protein
VDVAKGADTSVLRHGLPWAATLWLSLKKRFRDFASALLAFLLDNAPYCFIISPISFLLKNS